MIQGPNVKRLICHKISIDAVPPNGGVADALRFITDKNRISEGAKAATAWVESAIRAVREASEPNPWKTATDEEIAEEVLRQVAERKKAQRAGRFLA